MARDKGLPTPIDPEPEAPTQDDVDEAVAVENDAARNAQEAELGLPDERADEAAAVHGATIIRGE